MAYPVTRRITVTYVLVLVFLAAAALLSYGYFLIQVDHHRNDAAEINLSGYQRMLSQKQVHLALRLVHARGSAQRQWLRRELLATSREMEEGHMNLERGYPEEGLPGELSPELEAIYFGEPMNLDRQVHERLGHIQAFAETADDALTPNNPHLRAIVATAPNILVALDAAVDQFQKENEARVAQLVITANVGLAMSLVILLCSGLFIFRPMVAHIRRENEQRKEAEKQLIQAQKMEAVGQLTGGIAHDFNNLLTVILGNLELLQERSAGDEKKIGWIESAITAANRGATLVHRLLAFSRKQTLAPETIDPVRLLPEIEVLLTRALGGGMKVEIIAPENSWRILADPAQLESALLNLALNARDAMPGGGKIVVEITNRHIDTTIAKAIDLDGGDYVMLSVSDNGIGMTQEVVEHVFEPFFTTKEVGEGSGLGLSMVYGFTRQSGGTVKIYSEPGQGSRITLYLPRAGESPESEASSRGVTPGGKGVPAK
ncbi:MAG: type IV pili methyl-accepting chemotaxis transducer N-terminal domain-containing protein [Alphaproteobacteria bacterium]|nr:type IV pili methyl-accepting chemotaxis transducer N-terminal domain-containing protein [Alphaproteobacteria bacterium]